MIQATTFDKSQGPKLMCGVLPLVAVKIKKKEEVFGSRAKTESLPRDSHIKMSGFIAEINTFTACYNLSVYLG